MNFRLVGVMTILLLVAGCFTREAKPVAPMMVHDDEMTCEQLAIEHAYTEKAVKRYTLADDQAKGRNAVMITGAVLLFPPLLLGTDWTNVTGEELEAIQQRRNVIAFLYDEKCSSKPCPDEAAGSCIAEKDIDAAADDLLRERHPQFFKPIQKCHLASGGRLTCKEYPR